MFNKGFVFGKFYPLHKGHLALIQFAAAQCRELVVLVCCSQQEIISAEIRMGWLKEELADFSGIHLMEYLYDEKNLPNTSVSSKEVSCIWADVFTSLLPDVDFLVTSETYGDYVAEYMQIQHKIFDHDRQNQPISASLIRENTLDYWQFLPDSVKRYFQKVIIISGTESTGKTTLAKQLASLLPAVLVEEAARELIADSQVFSELDLYRVAESHAESIRIAKSQLTPLVIVDTDVYITQAYADFIFSKQLKLSDTIYQQNHADLRLYLNAQVPFVQDGSRLLQKERDQLDAYHRKALSAYGQTYQEIEGEDWTHRTDQAGRLVSNLINKNWFT